MSLEPMKPYMPKRTRSDWRPECFRCDDTGLVMARLVDEDAAPASNGKPATVGGDTVFACDCCRKGQKMSGPAFPRWLAGSDCPYVVEYRTTDGGKHWELGRGNPMDRSASSAKAGDAEV
jgi:hypothetical protein